MELADFVKDSVMEAKLPHTAPKRLWTGSLLSVERQTKPAAIHIQYSLRPQCSSLGLDRSWMQLPALELVQPAAYTMS